MNNNVAAAATSTTTSTQQVQPKARLVTSTLLNQNTRYDTSNDIADKLESQFNVLQEMLAGKSEKEVQEFLSSSKDPNFNDLASGGFLFGVLTDPANASKHFAYLGMSVTDGWYQALLKMNMVLLEIFYKLKLQVRQQLLFFFAEAIRNNIPKIDNVLTNLLRTISDGTEYKETCAIVQGISEILIGQKEWMRSLKPSTTFAPIALLTFSRFISDHQQFNPNNDSRFKNALISVCEVLLKERFGDMLMLGRDLVLVLMRLSKIPQFLGIWKALLHNPTTLLPKFNGIGQLMSMPCSNFILSFRVSLHVSRRVEFLLKQKNITQSKHLEWFAKTHLNAVDSGSLRAEVMRYVWYNIHLPESQQPAAIDTRAQFLNWLLRNAKPGAEMQWCKLMLLFDWLGFDNQPPNSLPSVEPAFSVIRQLITSCPPLANSLIDFLIRISNTFYPPLTTYFSNCITTAMVSLSLAGMPIAEVLDNPRLEKLLKDSFRETFPGVFARKSSPPASVLPPATDIIGGTEQTVVLESGCVLSANKPSTFSAHTIAAEQSPSATVYPPKRPKKKHLKRKISSDVESGEEHLVEVIEMLSDVEEGDESQRLSALMPTLREEFKEYMERLDEVVRKPPEEGQEEAAEIMNSLLTQFATISEEDEMQESEQSETITECFLLIFNPYFCKKRYFPVDDQSEESLNEIFDQTPFYVIFRQLSMMNEGDSSRRPLLIILSNMRDKCTAVGYLFLFFIRAARREFNDEHAVSAYLDFCKIRDKKVEVQLVDDLQHCALIDHNLFAFLLPFVFDKMCTETIGSVELMHLMCRSIDAQELSTLIGEILRENIVLFRRDSFPTLLSLSLGWESIEQMILWQFIRAESVPVEWVLGIIPTLHYTMHPEACTNVLLMLKSMDHEPNIAIMRNLMCRPYKDLFVVHALKLLVDDDDNLSRVAQLLNNLLKKSIAANEIMNASFTQPKQKSKRVVTVDNIFAHLDQFRLNCLQKESKKAEAFLANSFLQEMFTSTRRDSKLADVRTKYSELYAVMEIFSEDGISTRGHRKNRNRIMEKDEEVKTKRRKVVNESDDDCFLSKVTEQHLYICHFLKLPINYLRCETVG